MCRPALLLLALCSLSGSKSVNGQPLFGHGLLPEQAAEGCIALFDGESTFGWKVEGDSRVVDGSLLLGGDSAARATTTSTFGDFELQFAYSGMQNSSAKLFLNGQEHALIPPSSSNSKIKATCRVRTQGQQHEVEQMAEAEGQVGGGRLIRDLGGQKYAGISRTPIEFRVPAGATLTLHSVCLRPLGTQPIFNGKDLAGWKAVPGKPSRFQITPEGELNILDGPGDLHTEEQWDDFLLQLDVKSNGQHLNSGVFFRCVPNEFWSGYEAQIRNQWQGDDRSKPVDFGTGGLYHRQRARKVVSSDGQWFTMTVLAKGRHIAVWVNGYQTVDFTENKPLGDHARKGGKVSAGTISLQGHDPTTNLSFRKIRIASLASPDPEREPGVSCVQLPAMLR